MAMESPPTISPFTEAVISEGEEVATSSERHGADGGAATSFQVSLLSFLQTTFDNEEIVLSGSSHLSDPNSSSDSEGYLDEEALFAPEGPAAATPAGPQLVDESTDSDTSECQIVKVESAPSAPVLRRSARLTQAAPSFVIDEAPSSSASTSTNRTPKPVASTSYQPGPSSSTKSQQLLSRHPRKRLRTSSLFRPATIPEIVDLTLDSEDDSDSDFGDFMSSAAASTSETTPVICKSEPTSESRPATDTSASSSTRTQQTMSRPMTRQQSTLQEQSGVNPRRNLRAHNIAECPMPGPIAANRAASHLPTQQTTDARNGSVIRPCSNCGFHRRKYAQRGGRPVPRPSLHPDRDRDFFEALQSSQMPMAASTCVECFRPSPARRSSQSQTTASGSAPQGPNHPFNFPPISVAPYVNLPPQLSPYVHILTAGAPLHLPRAAGNAYATSSQQNSLWESQLARAELNRMFTLSPSTSSNPPPPHRGISDEARSHPHASHQARGSAYEPGWGARAAPSTGTSVRQRISPPPPARNGSPSHDDHAGDQPQPHFRGNRAKKRTHGPDVPPASGNQQQQANRSRRIIQHFNPNQYWMERSPPNRPQNPVHNQSQNRPVYLMSPELAMPRGPAVPRDLNGLNANRGYQRMNPAQQEAPANPAHPNSAVHPIATPCNCHLSQILPLYQHYHSATAGVPPPPTTSTSATSHESTQTPGHLYRRYDQPFQTFLLESPIFYPRRANLQPGRLSMSIPYFQGGTGGGNFPGVPLRNDGILPNVIESCTVKYTLKLQDTVREASKCSICLTEYAVEDSARRLPCMHLFHTECIDTWLKTDKRCPVCRVDITLRPEELLQNVQPSTSIRIPSGDNPTVLPPPPITVQGTAVE